MDAKEARATLFKERGVATNDEERTIMKYWRAKGYLEALKGPEVQRLVWYLKKIMDHSSSYATSMSASDALSEFLEAVEK